MGNRIAKVERVTKETEISLKINLDGREKAIFSLIQASLIIC